VDQIVGKVRLALSPPVKHWWSSTLYVTSRGLTTSDAVYAHAFWRILVQVDRLFKQFRAAFIGKCSPVHFFWGSFDLAFTRFSGYCQLNASGTSSGTLWYHRLHDNIILTLVWCHTFGQHAANQLRRRRPQTGDKWHLDEVFLKINGKLHYLWRAVDQAGHVLDILVQSRRNRQAAKKFFRKLLKGCQYVSETRRIPNEPMRIIIVLGFFESCMCTFRRRLYFGAGPNSRR
jgi:hypothetical protein